MTRHFGDIKGIDVGNTFVSRKELADVGVHKPTQAGISGSQHEGADSIVVSGGYEDDEDYGDLIIYTGHGGRDPSSNKQIADQTLDRGNMALAVSMTRGLPVRVVRGANHGSEYAPDSGYRYDGLYRVDRYWQETGRSGFKVWRFRLERESNNLSGDDRTGRGKKPRRTEQNTVRIVRDTALGREVKAIYDYRCQVCNLRLEGPAGPYAEAAHIRPLGRPHDGPDEISNVLCLCPNHHVLLDIGALTINDDFTINESTDRLSVDPTHRISTKYLRYHRGLFESEDN